MLELDLSASEVAPAAAAAAVGRPSCGGAAPVPGVLTVAADCGVTPADDDATGTYTVKLHHIKVRCQQGSHRPQTPPPVLPPGGQFKHTSFLSLHTQEQWNIICKHDMINIQHAHCGLVGLD